MSGVDVLSVTAVLETTDALLHQLQMDPEVKAMHIARFAEVRAALLAVVEEARDVIAHGYEYRENIGHAFAVSAAYTDSLRAALDRVGGAK